MDGKEEEKTGGSVEGEEKEEMEVEKEDGSPIPVVVATERGEVSEGFMDLKDCRGLLQRKHFIDEEPETMWEMLKAEMRFTLVDLISSMKVYFVHTVNLEGFLVVLNAVLVTLFFLEFEDSEMMHLASRLDFSILAFAVVFPLTYLLQQAFTRRESALVYVANFKSSLISIVIADLTWDFPVAETKKWGGRATLPEDFNLRVRNSACEMAELVFQYLSLPIVTKGRNYIFGSYRKKQSQVNNVRNSIEKRLATLWVQLYDLVEVLKAHGMPGNESSRINQYLSFTQLHVNLLRNQKVYRTPQATRSFGRAYLIMLPWFFGPYFAFVAGLGDTEETNKGFALALAAFTFLVLIGLINAGRLLEDSFLEQGFDHINVREEMALLIQGINFHFEQAEKSRRAN